MTHHELKIRPARIEDAPAVTACVNAAFGRYIERIGIPPGPMYNDYPQMIRRHPVFVLIAETNIIGVIVLVKQPRGILLDTIAVHPDHQRRGLGQRLMAFTEREALRAGYTSVTLYTNACMTESFSFYKNLGYVETERKTESGYNRIYMQKDLSEKTRRFL
jgi:ribosomal protein S18 acetylase RimI-like enzyme